MKYGIFFCDFFVGDMWRLSFGLFVPAVLDVE